MPTSPDLDALVAKRDQLKLQLSQIGAMRPGSLVARFRKCGKAACHCAKKGSRGHGPSFSLTHAVGGKTVTRIIPAGPAVEQTRSQLEEYHRFRELVQQLIAISAQICDGQLREDQPPSEGVKKNSARQPPRR